MTIISVNICSQLVLIGINSIQRWTIILTDPDPDLDPCFEPIVRVTEMLLHMADNHR